MITNVRTFVRDFAALRERARLGEIIHIRDGAEGYVFQATKTNRSLLGAANGRIRIHADLTKPTLKVDA